MLLLSFSRTPCLWATGRCGSWRLCNGGAAPPKRCKITSSAFMPVGGVLTDRRSVRPYPYYYRSLFTFRDGKCASGVLESRAGPGSPEPRVGQTLSTSFGVTWAPQSFSLPRLYRVVTSDGVLRSPPRQDHIAQLDEGFMRWFDRSRYCRIPSLLGRTQAELDASVWQGRELRLE